MKFPVPCTLKISRKWIFNWAYSVLFEHFRDHEIQVCRLRSLGVFRCQLVALSPLGGSLSSMKPLSSSCASVHDRYFQDLRGNGLVESFWIAWTSLTELNQLSVKVEVSVWWQLRHFPPLAYIGLKGQNRM